MILNEDLFRSIDTIYTENYLSYLRACASLSGNPYDIHIKTFGDVIATVYPEDPHFNHVFNLSERTIDRLTQIKGFYKQHHLSFWITMNPIDFTVKVSQSFIKQNFYPAGYHTKFIGRPTQAKMISTPGIRTYRVKAKNLERAVETSLEGIGVPKKAWEQQKPRIRLHLEIPETYWFYAKVDGIAAGTGFSYIKNNFAYLAGAHTRQTFRGRGCQTALINRRIKLAEELGCEFIVGAADFGTTSFRNMLRSGLQIAYTEVWWQGMP